MIDSLIHLIAIKMCWLVFIVIDYSCLWLNSWTDQEFKNNRLASNAACNMALNNWGSK